MRLGFLCFLLSAVVVVRSADEYPGTFLIVAPRIIRPGLPYSVYLSILDNSRTTQDVELKIKNGLNRTIASATVSNMPRGTSRLVEFGDISSRSLLPGDTYRLYAKGKTDRGSSLFEEEEKIEFDSKTLSIFVQTDKPIYKPLQLVRLRVVVTDSELKPHSGRVDVKIKDANENIIKQWLDERLSSGVTSLSIQLSDEPPLGDWQVEVRTDTGVETIHSFTVEKYVLPKFEVSLEPPSVVTSSDQDIPIVVKAKYTYGQGVEGTASVEVQGQFHGPIHIHHGPRRRFGPEMPESSSIRKSAALRNGEATLRFTMRELQNGGLLQAGQSYQQSLTLEAAVTEQHTEIQRLATEHLTVYDKAYKAEIITLTEYFKPGLNFEFIVAAKQQDGSPLPRQRTRRAQLTTRYQFDGNRREQKEERAIDLEADGTRAVVSSAPDGATSLRIEFSYDGASASSYVQPFDSPSQQFVTLTTVQSSAPLLVGDTARLQVRATESVRDLAVHVVARGRLLHSERLSGQRSASVSFRVTREMAPQARVVVTAIGRTDSEVLVDARDLAVRPEDVYENDVSLRADRVTAEPGNSISFTVDAEPNSFVGLRAVDQSVLLLKSDSDLTRQAVTDELRSYNVADFDYDDDDYDYGDYPGPIGRRKKRSSPIGPWHWRGGSNAKQTFREAGLVVLTDGLLHGGNIHPYYYMEFEDLDCRNCGGPVGMPRPMPAARGRGGSAQKKTDEAEGDRAAAGGEPPRLRKTFPETWVWADMRASSNGKAVHSVTVPDSITSWVASAFAVHDIQGLGVAEEPIKVQVFRPFFAQLNLPYSVKRGEHLALQVLIFNYMPSAQTATVTLERESRSGFDFVEQNGAVSKPSRDKPLSDFNVRTARVSGNGGSEAVYFPIVPTKLGNIKLRVIARANRAGDAVERSLLVEPEGYRVDRNQPVVVDLSDKTRFDKSIRLDFPDDVVEGSEGAKVEVIGDIMGPILNDIDNLIQMPYGCGEQNMVVLVPNIVVMQYLKATSHITADLEEKATKYMEAGYQRELTYKHSDGSFSAFGDSDPHGSTWLTAFVVRSFKQANPFIFVDEAVLRRSIDFLLEQQKSDGSFAEKGQVHHKAMQGGASRGGVPMTAYVLISLLENKVSNAKAQAYLEDKLESIRREPYTVALAAYALQLARSSRRDEALGYLEDLAIEKDGGVHWSDSREEPKHNDYYYGPQTLDVETTAYALLTYMNKAAISKGLPIVRWLSLQRNSMGGFGSTQDTVVGLQSLGAYAEEAYSPRFDVSIAAKNGRHRHTFERLTSRNALVLQSYEVDDLRSPVELDASGSGVVYAQVSWNYHLTRLRDDEPFNCDQTVREKGSDGLSLDLCCRYKKRGKSNMALAEVDALSGWAFDEEDLQSLTKIPAVQRVESTKLNSHANIYLSSLDSKPVCMRLKSQRQFAVAEEKPAQIRLLDYYERADEVKLTYSTNKRRSGDEFCPHRNCWPGGEGGSGGNSVQSDGVLLQTDCSDAWHVERCQTLSRRGFCGPRDRQRDGKRRTTVQQNCARTCDLC